MEDLGSIIGALALLLYPYLTYLAVRIIAIPFHQRVLEANERKIIKAYKRAAEARRIQRRRQTALQENQERVQKIKETSFGLSKVEKGRELEEFW